jgi:hypothetical protein
MRLATLLFIFMPFVALSQLYVDGRVKPSNISQLHKLVTKRGDVFHGNVARYDQGKIKFNVPKMGLLKFDFSEVDSVILEKKGWDSSFPTNFTERSMVLPTAFSIKRGEWEYMNRMLAANSINYGVRDNYTLAAGISPIRYGMMSWVNVKYSKRVIRGFHAAAGGIMSIGKYAPYQDFEFLDTRYKLGIVYTAFTIGQRNLFLNINLAKGLYLQSGASESSDWLYGFSGFARVSSRFNLFAEWSKHLPNFQDPSLNIGFSILRENSSTYLSILSSKDFGVIPMVGFNKKMFQE